MDPSICVGAIEEMQEWLSQETKSWISLEKH